MLRYSLCVFNGQSILYRKANDLLTQEKCPRVLISLAVYIMHSVLLSCVTETNNSVRFVFVIIISLWLERSICFLLKLKFYQYEFFEGSVFFGALHALGST